MSSPQLPDELANLLEAFCLGELTSTQAARIEQLVFDEPENRVHYLRFVQMHALAIRFEAVRPLGALELGNVSLDGDRSRSPQPGSPPLGFLGKVTARSANWWTSPRLLVAAVSACLVTYFALLVLGLGVQRAWWSDRKDWQALTESQDAQGFARLVASEACRWDADKPKPLEGRPVASAPLKLLRGLAELQFASGAKVVVEGPAEFEVRSSNTAFLKSGKLVARVPKRAVGFTVDTPAGRIVDLGTEFAVEVTEHGPTEVQVFEGQVELSSKASLSQKARSSIILRAGSARRIDAPAAMTTIVEAVYEPERFARQVKRSGAAPIAVSAAIDSSESPREGYGVHNLINGSGMRGDRHSEMGKGTMWLSVPGKTKAEFVLFDLGRRHRLESMKVWNYNEQLYDAYRARGLKQADIYASISGKDDPLTRPEEWKLLVADQQFTCATGMASYATPDLIPLGNTEARFVAIVVDSRLGLPPRAGTPLFTFASGEPARTDKGEAGRGMYGNEFVTSTPLAVTALGVWVGAERLSGGATNVDFTASLYRGQGKSLALETRVTVPAGTVVDPAGFAYAPAVASLEANTHYAVVSFVGTSEVQFTPYAYGVNVGRFGFGTTFVENRFVYTTDPTIPPTATTAEHNLNLGPLLGGNLLVKAVDSATVLPVNDADEHPDRKGVGLSEVQFFGSRKPSPGLGKAPMNAN